ncbi:ARF GTPase-activating protein GIT2 isoform X1 [Rhopalosiphum padi]|uniref:ARF GTPase-activating protein GIT2 isoform X1 n=1 Tax=Rhopalosiphum padi TaxID=40932 RepID=UPI00298E01E3|nr:ARF GTPase-activating protein GIT2 isoform X1 [Rhopalosiphum padi]
MSNKYKNYDACADCSAPDSDWVVVNRGLYICDECCSIHRSIGRHISQIKSLSADWCPITLNMVRTLHQANVNTLWEHALSDNKNHRKKPTPKDPLPLKEDFIRAKHRQQLFILKSSDTREDLNQQLHSSVRTSNLETSLRILAQGADSNYYHPEKGNYPLHVAAKAGQILQAELLLTYGADPRAIDSNGNTPAICAKLSGHKDISDRLNDSMYEVLDVLSMYVFGRKAEHKNDVHMIPFDPNDECIKQEGDQQEAIQKMQQLPNYLFEDLVLDVFDEIDRRETEKIWQQKNSHAHIMSVPFLPVNPDLSSMKNQGRQKLACYGQKEFKNLVKQILIEINRRTQPVNKVISKLKYDDDEPLYDHVASDEDYATPEQIAAMMTIQIKPPINLNSKENSLQIEKNAIEETVDSNKMSMNHAVPNLPLFNGKAFETKLSESEAKISKLISEIDLLKKKVEEVTKENLELKCEMLRQKQPTLAINENECGDVKQPIRPVSMYETREGIKCDMNRSTQTGSLPLYEDVVRHTAQVTKGIQELWTNIRSSEACKAFVPGTEKIRTAVVELTAIFPHSINDDVLKSALWSLNTNTTQLQLECACLEAGVERVRDCSFNIAKATKQLLTRF